MAALKATVLMATVLWRDAVRACDGAAHAAVSERGAGAQSQQAAPPAAAPAAHADGAEEHAQLPALTAELCSRAVAEAAAAAA